MKPALQLLDKYIRKFLVIFVTFFFASLIFLTVSVSKTYAATLYWVGADEANTSVASNWSTTNPSSCSTGVTPSGAAPASGDTINFDADCDNGATWNTSAAAAVSVMTLNTGYSGTVTLARSLQTTSTFTISGGTFTATNQTLDIDSTFTLNSPGTFTASSGTSSFALGFTINGGTFNHNNGTIVFDGTGSGTISCNSVTFNSVSFTNTSSGIKTVSSNCTLPLGASPALGNTSSSGGVTLNGTLTGTGTITQTAGIFTLNSGSSLSGFSGVSIYSLTIAGPTVDFGNYTTVDINNAFTLSSGTFTAPSGTMTVAGGFTISSGTFNHNSGTITFDGTGSATLSCNNATFNFISFNNTSSSTKTISSNCTLPLGNNPILGGPPSSSGGFVLNGTFSGTGTLTQSVGTLTLNSGAVLSGFNGLSVSVFNVGGATADLSSYTSLTAGGTVTLSSGSLSLPSGADLNGALTISGGTFNAPSGTMTVAGALTISGTPTFNANGGTITFDSGAATLSCNSVTFNLVTFNNSGQKTINSNCSLPLGPNPTLAGSSGIVLNGTLSGSGTLIKTGGTLTINSTGVLSGFSASSLAALTLSSLTMDLSSYTSITLSSVLTLTSSSLTLPSTRTLTGITMTSSTLSGSGTLASTGTITLNAGAILSGFSDMSVSILTIAGATADFSSYSTFTSSSVVTLSSGTLTLPNGADLNSSFVISGGTFNAPSGNMTLASAFLISGSPTFNHNNGTITSDGGGGSWSCNNVTFNRVVIGPISGGVTVGSSCNLPLGNNPTLFANGSSQVTVNGTLSGTGTLTVQNTFQLNSGAVLSGFTGLSTSSNGVNVAGASLDLSAYSSFFMAGGTLNLSSGSLSLPSGADLNGSLGISGGTFTAPSGTMTLAGFLTISGSPTFNANGGTIIFDGATTATISCNNVTFNSVGFAHISSTKTVSSNCTLPLGPNPTLSSAVTLNGTLSGSGTLTAPTTFTLNSSAVLSGFTGLIASANTTTVAGATLDFSSYSPFSVSGLTISSGSLTLPSAADINGGLTINGGTFNAPSGTMTIFSGLTISGSPTFNANGGTITFDGTSNANRTLSCNNVNFHRVNISYTDGVVTVNSNCSLPLGNDPTITNKIILQGTLTGSGTLTLQIQEISTSKGHTFNAGATLSGFDGLVVTALGDPSDALLFISGADLDVSDYDTVELEQFRIDSGSFEVSDMSLSGTFIVNGGNFIQTSGTLTLNGDDQSFTGSATFHNLEKTNGGTLTFEAGSTQTIEGDLILNGSSGDLLSLRSSVDGTQWNIDPQGDRDIQYVDVKDSNNINSTGIDPENSVNSGNNTGWNFSSPPNNPSDFAPSNLSDGGYTTDNQPRLEFDLTDSDTSNTLRYQIQIDNNSNFSSPEVDYTSGFGDQGETSFTVGRSTGSGSYANGESGQTLEDGSYYWRIRVFDNFGLQSEWVESNSGDIAFTVDTEDPSIPVPEFPSNNSYIINNSPTYKFKKSTDETSGVDRYTILLDDISLVGYIEPSEGNINSLTKYINFRGEYVYVQSRELIKILSEGKHTWEVTAYDKAGNTASLGVQTFYVDYTNPALKDITFDSPGKHEGYMLTSQTSPEIKGTITDNVSADKIIIWIYKQNFFLGVESDPTLIAVETHTLPVSDSNTNVLFTYTIQNTLDHGKYAFNFIGYDRAGNKSTQITENVQILPNERIIQLIGSDNVDRSVSQISLPELEKQAKIRKEAEANNLQGFLDTIKNVFNQVANATTSFGQQAFNLAASALTNVSNTLANSIPKIGESLFALGTNINNTIAETFSMLANNSPEAIKSLAQNIFINPFSEISLGLSKTNEEIASQIANSQNGVSRSIGQVSENIVDVFEVAQASIDNSTKNVKNEITTVYAEADKEIGKIQKGLHFAYASISKQTQPGVDVVTRIGKGSYVAFATFNAYVFDDDPTNITDVIIEEIGEDYMVVSWDTNHVTYNNKVNYGLNLEYGQEAWGENGNNHHVVKLTGLNPKTRYYFEVMSQNKNYTYDAFYSFETK